MLFQSALVALAFLGLLLVAWGVFILTTGRVLARTRRSFASTRNAGLYLICAGSGPTLIAATLMASNDMIKVPVWVAYAFAVLGGTVSVLGFVRYGPRGR